MMNMRSEISLSVNRSVCYGIGDTLLGSYGLQTKVICGRKLQSSIYSDLRNTYKVIEETVGVEFGMFDWLFVLE